jgi:hypothetical protein
MHLMPVDVRWLVTGRVVIHEFNERLTLDDATRASIEGPILAAQGTPPIHMVVNLLAVTQFPRSIQQLVVAIQNNPRLDRIGLLVVVTRQNPVLRFVATILTRVHYTTLRIAMAESMPGALQQIRAFDRSLEPWITVDGELTQTTG